MPEPIPSATVITLRETPEGIEILMLRKNSKIAYGGAWVFPGGKIDSGDFPNAIQTSDAESLFTAARNAAVREAKEEASISIDGDSMHFLSHWTTPIIRPRRFSTWFFVAKTDNDEVTIDGGEIHDYAWRSPKDMLQAHRNGEVELMPPTFISLTQLLEYRCYSSLLNTLIKQKPFYFSPRLIQHEGGVCHLYGGDAGFEDENVDAKGKRHRLWTNKNHAWVYERD